MIHVEDLEEIGFEMKSFLDGEPLGIKSKAYMLKDRLKLELTFAADDGETDIALLEIERIDGYASDPPNGLHEFMFTMENKKRKKKMIKLKDLLNVTKETVWVHQYAYGKGVKTFSCDKANEESVKEFGDAEIDQIDIVEKHGFNSLHVWLMDAGVNREDA